MHSIHAMPEFPRQLQPWLKRGPALANLLLALAIGLACARLFWLAWPVERAGVGEIAASADAPDPAPAVDVDAIAATDLFGVPAASTAATDAVIEAPETRLNLTLTGIVASVDAGGESRALIANASGEQRPYAIGDPVVDDVSLHAIYSNRVILDRSGRFETLTLERIKAEASVQRTAAGATVGGDLAADLAAVRQQILQQPASLSRYLRLQPQRENGKLVGYRVYPGQDRDLFQRVGLRPGELITAINGVPLSNPSDALKMLGQLAEASSVNITLVRDERERNITINFQ